jgi:hypothetical protein
MCGFCNVWLCVLVCVSMFIWGCFDNCEGVLVIRVLVFTVFCFVCTVFLYCFVYAYLFLFCLYWCKDYCHRVTTQLQLIIIITIIISQFCSHQQSVHYVLTRLSRFLWHTMLPNPSQYLYT